MPILVALVGQVSSDDERDLALLELLHGNAQRIRFAFEFHHDRCIHRDLQCAGAKNARLFVFRQEMRRFAVLCRNLHGVNSRALRTVYYRSSLINDIYPLWLWCLQQVRTVSETVV